MSDKNICRYTYVFLVNDNNEKRQIIDVIYCMLVIKNELYSQFVLDQHQVNVIQTYRKCFSLER